MINEPDTLAMTTPVIANSRKATSIAGKSVPSVLQQLANETSLSHQGRPVPAEYDEPYVAADYTPKQHYQSVGMSTLQQIT